jgi:hypothetical protein
LPLLHFCSCKMHSSSSPFHFLRAHAIFAAARCSQVLPHSILCMHTLLGEQSGVQIILFLVKKSSFSLPLLQFCSCKMHSSSFPFHFLRAHAIFVQLQDALDFFTIPFYVCTRCWESRVVSRIILFLVKKKAHYLCLSGLSYIFAAARCTRVLPHFIFCVHTLLGEQSLENLPCKSPFSGIARQSGFWVAQGVPTAQ